MTQRIFFSTLGVLVISTLGPNLLRWFGGGAEAYIRMSWVMAAIVFLAMGLAFGWLYEWTGQLLAPIVAHTVVNGINLPRLARRAEMRSDD